MKRKAKRLAYRAYSTISGLLLIILALGLVAEARIALTYYNLQWMLDIVSVLWLFSWLIKLIIKRL